MTLRGRARPSAILFDMDGLLIDSERVALESLDVAATKLSIEFPAHVAQRLIGLGRDGGSKVIRESLGDAFPLDEFWLAWSHDYLQRIEVGVPAKDAVSDTLAHLAELGVPMAVATSTETPWAKKKLLKAGIHHFFDHIVDAIWSRAANLRRICTLKRPCVCACRRKRAGRSRIRYLGFARQWPPARAHIGFRMSRSSQRTNCRTKSKR